MTELTNEEEEEETFCILDVSYLRYNIPHPPKCECNINEVLDVTLSTINTHQNRFRKEAFALLAANRLFIEAIIEDLFWLVQTRIFHPEDKKEIKHLVKKIGYLWGHFCYPFEADTKLNPTVREIFFDCIPYFYTQAIQHIYIKMSHGNPSTTSKHFRLTVCSHVVSIFTSINRLESQLEEKLGSFFEKAPPTEEFDNEKEQKTDEENFKTSLIPEEDVSTLIEMQRRKRPKNYHWSMSGMSPLISSSTNRRTLPYEYDSKILIQYPANGEADWTTQLPPLLPPAVNVNSQDLTIDNYDPMKEPRSLLQRSRRPFLANQLKTLKAKFRRELKKQEDIHQKIETSNKELKKAILVSKNADIDVFLKDLRQLQLENKRNQTPELVMVERSKLSKDGNDSKSSFSKVSAYMANRNANEQAIVEMDDESKIQERNKDEIVLFDPTVYMTLEPNF